MILLPVAERRETVRETWRLLRGRRRPLTVACLAFAVTGLAALVPPWVLGQIVDAVREGAEEGEVWRAAFAIVGAGLVGAVSTVVSASALARAGEPALAELREAVLDRALHLDTARLEEAGTGDVLSRVGDDVRTVAESLVEIVPMLINALVLIVFTGAGLFALDWRLGLAGLAAVPAYVLGLRWYLPRSNPFYARERVAQGERAEALVTGLQGAETLRAFGLESVWLARIDAASRRAADLAIEVFGLLVRFLGRNNRAELIGLLLVLGTGWLLVRDDATTVGAVSAAALYFHRLFNPIGVVLFSFDNVQSAGASLARLVGVARLPRPASAAPPEPFDGSVRLVGVGHAYVEGRPVLAGVDLVVVPGEHVAVVGTTGAGKTTLGGIVAGGIRPAEGRVHVGGHDLAGLSENRLRARLGLVTQEVHVFAGTVRDNVTLADPRADDDAVRAALRAVHAEGWVDSLTDGLDTTVGRHGHGLTSAQAQQLALARVVLRDPAVVVLDEATAEAGSSGARVLDTAAEAAITGRTALVIAHRLTQARDAGRILVMAEGRVVEDGSHEDLVATGGRYAELWAAWSAP